MLARHGPPRGARARLLVADGDALLAAGRTSAAAARYAQVAALVPDSSAGQLARVRAIRVLAVEAESVADLVAVGDRLQRVLQGGAAGAAASEGRSLAAQIQRLRQWDDLSEPARFQLAEAVRDSLGATRLAARLFLRFASEQPRALFAPKALVAAAARDLFGVTFQNPVLLASGTAGFGREVRDVIDLDALGGIVTKAVTPEPRRGHAAPRVAEFPGGMLNAVGLANPGLAAVRDEELPWLAAHLRRARVLVNVAGATVDDYVTVIRGLATSAVITAFELNASCPNTSAGGLEFGATPEGLRELVRRCRDVSSKPMTVKLSPVVPDLAALAQVARDEGADAVTRVNTIPGTLSYRLGNGA